MQLHDLFSVEDHGFLAEVEARFKNAEQMRRAFRYLFSCGGFDATRGGASYWHEPTQTEKMFSGPNDVAQIAEGPVDSLHLVLRGVVGAGAVIPELGVFVTADILVLDFHQGPHWSSPEIHSFLTLLSQFQKLGGVIAAPGWSPDAERSLLDAITSTQQTDNT